MTRSFKVVNRSNMVILCSITNQTNPSGHAGWFELKWDASETWNRSGWEDIQFQDKNNSQRKLGLWVNPGNPALVYFDGFDQEIKVYNDYKPEGSFLVKNTSNITISCWISTSSGGSNEWFRIRPGEKETWKRSGWETIAFRNENDSERTGIYVNNRDSLTTIDFHGFDQAIGIEHTSDTYLADEHYAEAIRIADRSFYAQSSRASTEGGLTASIYKIDILERMGSGRTTSLADHNQIYTLACLINHLKYGLAEPAIVVSVTPDWVKVAAYTAEFDTIVVLGFPTAAIDLVAPDKQRPAVGTRLLLVSQFSYRVPNRPPLLGDITPGPRSRNVWSNFQPLVAQYCTDDVYAPLWQERMARVDDDLWGDLWEGWLAWKARHGENYFRLGTPSKMCLISTQHSTEAPPTYTP